MAKDIDVKEVIKDKNSWFNIKRFKVKGISFKKPEKVLDVKNLKYFSFCYSLYDIGKYVFGRY